MGRLTATITIPSPTRRRANRSASAACRIRATDRGGRQHVVRTRSVHGKGAVVDRAVKRLGLVPYTLRATPVCGLTASVQAAEALKCLALMPKLSGPAATQTVRATKSWARKGPLQR